MRQCDACRDWFHWDCVGLTPPGDDEDDEEVAPADFQCPACCIKVRILVPAFCQAFISPGFISPGPISLCRLFISPAWVNHALRSPGGRVLAAPAASAHKKHARSFRDLQALAGNIVGWLLSS